MAGISPTTAAGDPPPKRRYRPVTMNEVRAILAAYDAQGWAAAMRAGEKLDRCRRLTGAILTTRGRKRAPTASKWPKADADRALILAHLEHGPASTRELADLTSRDLPSTNALCLRSGLVKDARRSAPGHLGNTTVIYWSLR